MTETTFDTPATKDKIKAQVLAFVKIPRLDRVEVSHHNNGRYRVNVWQQREQNKELAVSPGLQIAKSFYLVANQDGEITFSNPPLKV